MFFPRKGSGPLISSSSDKPVLRMLLLIVVFAATAAAFWWHFERRMADLNPPQGTRFFRDHDKLVPAEQARMLHRWRDIFKQDLGLDALVLLSKGPLRVPDFPQGTLFVGAGLEQHEALIILPALARKAMGEGTRLQLEEDLAACLKEQTQTFPCLNAALEGLAKALRE